MAAVKVSSVLWSRPASRRWQQGSAGVRQKRVAVWHALWLAVRCGSGLNLPLSEERLGQLREGAPRSDERVLAELTRA